MQKYTTNSLILLSFYFRFFPNIIGNKIQPNKIESIVNLIFTTIDSTFFVDLQQTTNAENTT